MYLEEKVSEGGLSHAEAVSVGLSAAETATISFSRTPDVGGTEMRLM
jgi:hypothetical protein